MNYLEDKLFVNKLLGQECWDLDFEIPKMYPVVVKHKTRDLGCYIAESYEEIEDWSGYYAQKWYLGVTGKITGIMVDGSISESLHVLSSKNLYGETTMYVSSPFFSKPLKQKISFIYQSYSGAFTIDYVDDNIVDWSTDFEDSLVKIAPLNAKLIYYAKIIRSRREGKVSLLDVPLGVNIQIPKHSPTISFCRRKVLIASTVYEKDLESKVKQIRIKIG